MVELIETLIGKGYQVKIFDKSVSLAWLNGANKAYIEREIPHIATLMCETLDEVLEHSDVIVIGNKAPEFLAALGRLQPHQVVIDLVRITNDAAALNGKYEGLCW
jgi:GDP-mannose 6-dehydrogenase